MALLKKARKRSASERLEYLRCNAGLEGRITMTSKICLYCGLQFPGSANFCPECGRFIERGYKILPVQKAECERPYKEMKQEEKCIDRQMFHYSGIDRRAESGKNPKQETSATLIP
jgi:hypothetical protein